MSLRIPIATIVLGLAVMCGGAEPAFGQGDPAAALRASGEAGEQPDGYLGVLGAGSTELRAQVERVNAMRRAYYTQLAARRGAAIEEVAAETACALFRTKVGPGQYYRLADGEWRQRDGSEPVPLPGHCG